MIKVFSKFPDGATNVSIGTFDGYTLRASCTAGDVENFQLISSDTQVAMTAQGNGNVGPNFDEEQRRRLDRTSSSIPASTTTTADRSRSASRRPAATPSRATSATTTRTSSGENVCAVYGHIILNNG